MATHSSTLAWEIPRTEEPGRLQFMELQKSRTWLGDKKQQNTCNRTIVLSEIIYMCEAKNAINHDPEDMNFYCGLQIEKKYKLFSVLLLLAYALKRQQ